jgi:hypothetical protein
MQMRDALHHTFDALGGFPIVGDVLQNSGAVEGARAMWPVVHCQQKIGDCTMGQQACVHRQGGVNEGRTHKFTPFGRIDLRIGGRDRCSGARSDAVCQHVLVPQMNTFIYLNGRPDHQKGQHDDLIMGISMAIYIAESSFSKLEKATDQAKSMIESWAIVNNEAVKNETHFDPLIPNQNILNERMGLNNNGASREDYQKYSWLFGGLIK